MHKNSLQALLFLVFISPGFSYAEPYVGISLGWSFNQKLSGITGNENLNYGSGGPLGVYPTAVDPTSALYPGTHYSSMNLKDALSAGIKLGYYFESMPNFGVELEANYSKPNILRQPVTISHPGFADTANGLGLGQNNFTEDQQSARAQLYLFSLNGLYRYQGFKDFTPYIGGGPALYIFKLSGTGHSGIITNPSAIADPIGVDGPAVSETTTQLGINFKLGAEYKINGLWGVGAEYHFNWSPVDVSNFRSASDVSADYRSHALNFSLMRHF